MVFKPSSPFIWNFNAISCAYAPRNVNWPNYYVHSEWVDKDAQKILNVFYVARFSVFFYHSIVLMLPSDLQTIYPKSRKTSSYCPNNQPTIFPFFKPLCVLFFIAFLLFSLLLILNAVNGLCQWYPLGAVLELKDASSNDNLLFFFAVLHIRARVVVPCLYQRRWWSACLLSFGHLCLCVWQPVPKKVIIINRQ